MNKKILLVTLCATFVAFVLLGQNQDIRRGGGSGGSGVSVAAGTGITTSTNSGIVTVSNSGVLGVAAGSNITTTTNNGIVSVTAVTQTSGLFYNGVTNVSIVDMTIDSTYNGKLVRNTTADSTANINLPTDAAGSFPIGGYVYVYYPGLPGAVAGAVASSSGANITRFGSGNNIAGTYALVKLYKVAANTWHAEGDLTIP